MPRTRAATKRSPIKKLGGQNSGSDEEEIERPIQPKRSTAAATRLKKATAAKKAKKSSLLTKKKKTSAKKVPSPPIGSDDDEEMEDGDAEDPGANVDPGKPSPTTGLSFDFKHLAQYLSKAKKASFNKRSEEEKALIAEKIERDLQRINFWVGERATKGGSAKKRKAGKPGGAVGGGKKAGKGKGRAKVADTEDDAEEDDEGSMDDEDDISDGKYPFVDHAPPFRATAASLLHHYYYRIITSYHYSLIWVCWLIRFNLLLLFHEFAIYCRIYCNLFHYLPIIALFADSCTPRRHDSCTTPNPVLTTTLLSSIDLAGGHGIGSGRQRRER
jgi:hypothetical protein